MAQDLQKPEVIEPEIIIPGNIPCNAQPFEQRAHAAEVAGGFIGSLLRGLFTFAIAALTFMIFLAVILVVAVPVLIMALLGKKPNIKIFKYRI